MGLQGVTGLHRLKSIGYKSIEGLQEGLQAKEGLQINVPNEQPASTGKNLHVRTCKKGQVT